MLSRRKGAKTQSFASGVCTSVKATWTLRRIELIEANRSAQENVAYGSLKIGRSGVAGGRGIE
jgi:hypothetical protein